MTTSKGLPEQRWESVEQDLVARVFSIYSNLYILKRNNAAEVKRTCNLTAYNPYFRNKWFVWVDRYMWFDRCMRFDSCMRGPSAKGCCFTSELHMPLPLSTPNNDGNVVVAARSPHCQTPQTELSAIWGPHTGREREDLRNHTCIVEQYRKENILAGSRCHIFFVLANRDMGYELEH